MKNYQLLILLGILGLVSCRKDELDLFPYNQVETSQAFNTEADINLAVNGMYTGLRATNTYFVNGTWNIIADVLADNLIINQTGRLTLKTFGEWRFTGEDTYLLFNGGYTITRRANAILENIEKFPAGAFKDNAMGEALAIRAMVYFDMSRVYSKTYLNATDSDSTLPYVVSTEADITPAKESVRAFYEKVIADLVQAQSLIADNNGVGRFKKTAVSGLLSRVYLYKGDWANAIQSANAALGTSPVLPGIAAFPNLWKDATEDGVLFKVKNTNIDNLNAQGVNYYQAVTGGIKSEYVVEYNFKQLFLSNDVRTSTYISTSAFNGVPYNHVVKHAGRAGSPAGVVDAKVLRTAEVLLNRAESFYRNINEPAALADLNLLKANRYTGHVNVMLSGPALLNEILKERRLELAFEGDRFWDIKRRNASVIRDGTKGDKADGTGSPFVFTTLNSGDPKFQLPFPQAEINFNTNLKQNPGY
ncbi:MAG: RagB/SusD family nutrient uptake outer membrane protein [Chitinophagaceae bacterium]|nr:MAG: RagB/SusD family nutrient uptake outer membrane protein [Chitinophagaceae bacterium]